MNNKLVQLKLYDLNDPTCWSMPDLKILCFRKTTWLYQRFKGNFALQTGI